MDCKPLIIVGSGLAGYTLAKEWRRFDTKTPLIIITADDGAFYSKPLLSTALMQKKTPEQLVISDVKTLEQDLKAKIYCFSVVKRIDTTNNIVYFEDESLVFSKLVIACGAEVIFPSLCGDAVSAIQSINSLSDYRDFRQWLNNKKHIVILGVGLVGCEFANDMVNAGYLATLIAPDTYPLMRVLPKTIGHLLQAQLSQKGVAWRLGETVAEINYYRQQLAITLSSGENILADGVLSALRLRPKIDFAKNSGIVINRGIVVNQFHQTNFSDIFALGDCVEINGSIRMYVGPLLRSARSLAKILTGEYEPVSYPIMPITIKTSALPLIVSPPPADISGEWKIEGEFLNLRALFYDKNDQLYGFVLTGTEIRNKALMTKNCYHFLID